MQSLVISPAIIDPRYTEFTLFTLDNNPIYSTLLGIAIAIS